MVFEAVVYCVDNSDFSINGDGSITRRQSQSDTINRLAASKIAESPETTVGLISMAGKRTTVMVPSTREPGEVLRTMHSLKNGGRCNILASLKTAQLVLKNRHNKNQKQRVILFIGSPIENDAASLLMKQAKIMKKNSVALDAVHFGIENVQSADNENLRKLVETANSGNNGRLVSVGEGESLADTAFGELAKVPQNGSAEMEDDPELALALKMSLEENQS
ncbi:hypothetical protein MHBO_004232 [Bonamia ostreae]|uniref:VWFA domain-containing protein n=1 Tax=Bonamia ostreae TaxID=126728 RepID=A0ABV2ASU2_9EUKA